MTDSVLAGATVRFNVLADGTPRVVIDFAPNDADAAYKLCGKPGQPVALAALKVGFEAKGEKPAPASYSDLGPICREAINLCANPMFHDYVKHVQKFIKDDARGDTMKVFAKSFILTQCNVDSRKDLDTAEGARELFISHIRTPFLRWKEST